MPRGRPTKSEIRQNIIEIIFVIGKGYGYEIHKIYKEIYPNCTRENIYYNLHKGVALGELEMEEVKEEHGNYSWGSIVIKKYYKLSSKAQPKGDSRVKEFIDKMKRRQ